MSLPILSFHAIDRTRGPLAADPSWFAESMAWLHAEGYRSISLSNWLARGRETEPRTFALAFDDGIASTSAAADVLARFGYTATVFVVSDYVGKDNGWPSQPRWAPRWRLLDWSEIDDLRRRGWEVGAHSRTHPRLDQIDRRELEHELRGAREAIEHRVGASCPLLAYPYGAKTDAALRWFDAAFGTRLDFAASNGPRDDIARIDAHYLRNPRRFRQVVARRARGWLHLRNALRTVRGLRERRRVPFGSQSEIVHASPRVRPVGAGRARDVVCPHCRGVIEDCVRLSICNSCKREFPRVAGILDLRTHSDRYLDVGADRAKAERLGEKSRGRGLMELASDYYAMTADVDAPRRRLYLDHISRAAIRGRELSRLVPAGARVLEVGCGSGGFVSAMSSAGREVVGCDIALRWLVIAGKRLEEQGVSAPLIGACAERLPWGDAGFDAVVADSVLEHLDDPLAALLEWRRVVRPGGRLILWAPNRFSLLRDPHVNLWGVGWLPRRLATRYVRARSGREWTIRPFSRNRLARLARDAGWSAVRVEPARLTTEMARTRGEAIGLALYSALRRAPLARSALTLAGPVLQLVAEREDRCPHS